MEIVKKELRARDSDVPEHLRAGFLIQLRMSDQQPRRSGVFLLSTLKSVDAVNYLHRMGA